MRWGLTRGSGICRRGKIGDGCARALDVELRRWILRDRLLGSLLVSVCCLTRSPGLLPPHRVVEIISGDVQPDYPLLGVLKQIRDESPPTPFLPLLLPLFQMLEVSVDEPPKRVVAHRRRELVEFAVFFWLFRRVGALTGSIGAGLALGGQGLPARMPPLRSASHAGRKGDVEGEALAICGGEAAL